MTEIRRRTAHVNGVDLDVLESGPVDGPVVILSHGFPESSLVVAAPASGPG